MNKKCSIVIGLLLVVIAGGIYKFIFQGSVSDSADGRVAIHLNSSETDLVLAEMRASIICCHRSLGINRQLAVYAGGISTEEKRLDLALELFSQYCCCQGLGIFGVDKQLIYNIPQACRWDKFLNR